MLSVLAAIFAALLVYWLGGMLLPDEPIIVFGAAFLLGLITRTVIYKLWETRQKRINDSIIFPLLKRKELEKWGSKWGEQYEYLTGVVLYDPPLKYPIDAEYILYFDFDTSTTEGKQSKEIFNETFAFQNTDILGPGFQDVYGDVPGSQFRDEWFLSIVKHAEFNDKYSWVIYQREARDQPNYNEEASKELNQIDNIRA
jgi:hypothetical protein